MCAIIESEEITLEKNLTVYKLAKKWKDGKITGLIAEYDTPLNKTIAAAGSTIRSIRLINTRESTGRFHLSLKPDHLIRFKRKQRWCEIVILKGYIPKRTKIQYARNDRVSYILNDKQVILSPKVHFTKILTLSEEDKIWTNIKDKS